LAPRRKGNFTTMDTYTSSRLSRSAQTREIIAILAEFWPNCFAVYEQRRRPLKIGIHDDLTAAAAGAVTSAEIALALRFYTSNLAYLRACYAGADRIDLEGQVVGRVTEHEAAAAATKLAHIRRLILTRKTGNKTGNKVEKPSEIIVLPARRLSLLDLRLMAQARRAAVS
jgi:ProP effector